MKRHAKYMEIPEEFSYGEAKPWMDYVEEKEEGSPEAPSTVVDMLKDMPGEGGDLDDPISQYNPYDYSDPSSKPKDMKDSKPFTNTMNPALDYGLFMTPHVFGPDGPHLKEWRDVSRTDFTTDEDEQNPAISLTRKKASVQNVLAQYLLQSQPLELYLSDLAEYHKDAASLEQIISSDTHYKRQLKEQRARILRGRVVWENQRNEEEKNKGFLRFKVYGTSGVYTVYMQFLKSGEGQTQTDYVQFPCEVACTCPSFLYHGAQFYAVRDRYMYTPAFRPDLVSPRMQNMWTAPKVSPHYPGGKRHPGRGLNFRACKHIFAVYEKIRTWKIEVPSMDFPETGAPSKIINKDEWKKMMKFPFDKETIRERLKAPRVVIPAFYNTENITRDVIDWFNNVWTPTPEVGKIKMLKDMVQNPERIFYCLLKEADIQKRRGAMISDTLIDQGFELMSRMIKPESQETPQQVEEAKIPPDQRGTGFAPPGADYAADKFLQGEEVKRAPGEPTDIERREKKRKQWHETLKDRTERRKKEREEKQGPKPKSMIKRVPRGTISPLSVVQRFQMMSE